MYAEQSDRRMRYNVCITIVWSEQVPCCCTIVTPSIFIPGPLAHLAAIFCVRKSERE